MAQLKDLIVTGASRFINDVVTNSIQITKLAIPTSSGGSTYGAGTSGQVIKTNGTSIYWATLGAAAAKAVDTSISVGSTSTNLPTSAAVATFVNNLKGTANGIAELDNNGKVLSSQLPSYVDDVIEGYYYNSKFYEDSAHTSEITGETGKIYIDLSTEKTYRWSGTAYAEISASLALGETSSTAYRGDRGKTAYDHSQLTSGNPHNVTKTDLGLGNVDNTSDNTKKTNFTGTIEADNTGFVTGGDIYTTLGSYMPLSYLNSTTLSSLTAAAMGTTANRQYVVGLDANGNLSVNIPWTDHIYNFTGTTFASGNGTTGEHNANNMTYNGSFYIGNSQNNPPVTLGVQNADAAVHVQAYNDQWVVQLAQDYRDGQIFVRSKKQGTWQAWKAVPMFTTTNGAKGSATQPLYIDADGMLQPTTYTLGKSVPADAVFTDTTYTFDGTYNASTNKAATQSTVTSAINALPKRNPNGGVQKVPIDMDTSTGTFSTTITPQDIDEGFTAFEESQPSFTNSSSTVLYIGEQNASEDNRYKFEAPIVVRYQSIDGFEFQSPIVALDSIGLTGEIGFLYLETYGGYNSPYHLTLTHWPSSSVTSVNGSTGAVTLTIPTKTSDLTNDSEFITGMTILSYGSSTWNDFINAYDANKVVYCRASPSANPASGSQTRLAFMAYVNNATIPKYVEFQYYRSVSSHTEAQQGDQVFVYTLDKNTGWSVTTRETSVKVAYNNGITGTYSDGVMTLKHANSAITAQSTQAIYPIAIDAYGHITGYGSAVTIPEIPTVTSSDNGKFLRVVNGAWAADTVSNASGVSF